MSEHQALQERFRVLEVGGGTVSHGRLRLPPVVVGYADAQLDDYGSARRRKYRWRPGTQMSVRARFSHGDGQLTGTAGFGFWNAPFGDPSVRWPALPQAVWFFYGSSPTDLPLAPKGPGRGWHAATIDAGSRSAVAMIPISPLVIILNQFRGWRQRYWPKIQRLLNIRFAPLSCEMTEWHDYSLDWQPHGSFFRVDGEAVLSTSCTPRGPLGFVCWLDNQYLVATPRGRIRWGTCQIDQEEWLEFSELKLSKMA